MVKEFNKNSASIAIIVCFFGRFPQYINLWLKSCFYNPTIDWIIFGDQELNDAPPNVHFNKITFSELRTLFSDKLGFQIALNYPYKICEFRPAYGMIFQDYIQGYDFWGHCDLDMIFGDLRKFLTPDILEAYDKVLWFGHIAFYRNSPEVNKRYKLKGGSVDYKTVFTTDKHFAFDEVGINNIFCQNNFPVFHKPFIIDVIFYRKHYSGFNMKNYSKQMFFWENGRVFQAFQRNGEVVKKEFMSIHFQKRKFTHFLMDNPHLKAFFFSPEGFFIKEPGVIKPQDFQKYNKNPGLIYEFIVMQIYFVKLRYSRLIQWFHGKSRKTEK